MVEFFLFLLFVMVCIISLYAEIRIRRMIEQQKIFSDTLEDMVKETLDRRIKELLPEPEPIIEPDPPAEPDKKYRNIDGKLSYKAALENKRIAEKAKQEGAIEDLEGTVWKQTGGR